MSDVDLPAVRRALHDAAFSVLRTSTRDPWNIQQNEAQVRSVVSASLQGEEIPGTVPDFASRLVLPGREQVKPRVKLIMQTEEKYAQYMELLDVVDSVKSREERCTKFRNNLRKHMPDLKESISDKIFALEMEELKLKRDVRNIIRGHDPGGPVQISTQDEKLALFAATSLQPALRVILHAALKSTGAEPSAAPPDEFGLAAVTRAAAAAEAEEGGGGAFLHRDDAMDKLAKKLERATKGGLREAGMVKEGVTALKDRGRALVSLHENLREEVFQASHEQDFSELQLRLARKAAAVERLKLLCRNGRDVDYPAAVLSAMVRRRFAMNDREDERRVKAIRTLQAMVRRGNEEGLLDAAKVIAAIMRSGMAANRFGSKRQAAKLLTAVLRRGVQAPEEKAAEGGDGEAEEQQGEAADDADAIEQRLANLQSNKEDLKAKIQAKKRRKQARKDAGNSGESSEEGWSSEEG